MSTLPKWSFTFRVRDTDEIPLARFGNRPLYSIDAEGETFVDALQRARSECIRRSNDLDIADIYCIGATPENYRATELRADYKEPRLSTVEIIACPPNSVATQADGERWIRDRYGNWRIVGKNGKPRHNVAARSVLDICHNGLVDLEIP